MRPTSFLLKTNAHPNPSNAAGDPCAAWAQAAGMASTRHRPNQAPRSEPNHASLALRQPTGFFQSCVSALRASRILLCTATTGPSTPAVGILALRAWNHRRLRCLVAINLKLGNTVPRRRFALPWAISLCPFGAVGFDGSSGNTRSETAKQATRSVVRSAVHRLTVV
jgi:hypothetical protein